ncbi:MAG: FMN-dependent NADH-azoreductase [Candidatus Tokpelaia sp. JSC188]|nr:MAG: FMN-dependent NADH-azoreductase [Candidatus Tokpelaia sp. JSC188]
MNKILVLKSSIKGSNSNTSALADKFLAERRAKGIKDKVIEHDLVAENIPVLDGELFSALCGAKNLSKRAKEVIALSDKLVFELKTSNLLVIAAPMYNFNVPTHLKNWFDLVARARITFQYTETNPIGLIKGVCAFVISSRGDMYINYETDIITLYLRAVLGLIGITDINFIYAEGLNIRLDNNEKKNQSLTR